MRVKFLQTEHDADRVVSFNRFGYEDVKWLSRVCLQVHSLLYIDVYDTTRT
jgi:hypothetical protein